MWTFFVVFFSPSFDDEACVVDVHKGMLIQALSTEATVEEFDESILNWLPGFTKFNFIAA